MRRDRLSANSPYEILTGERCQLKVVSAPALRLANLHRRARLLSVAAWSKGKRNDRDRRF